MVQSATGDGDRGVKQRQDRLKWWKCLRGWGSGCEPKTKPFEVVRSASGNGDQGVEQIQDRLEWFEMPQGMGIRVWNKDKTVGSGSKCLRGWGIGCGTKTKPFEVVRSASRDGDRSVQQRQDRLKWFEVPPEMGVEV